jgi:hypothetical protein
LSDRQTKWNKLVNHTKKKKTIINESNLKRKMIRKTWEKNIFSKWDERCISIRNLLNMKEQNEEKKT